MNVISQRRNNDWGVWVLVLILVTILVVRLRSVGDEQVLPSPSPGVVPVEELEDVLVADDETLIEGAVLRRVDLHEGQVDFSIDENTGTYAKGLIKEIGTVSGGYWLAVKDGDKWIAVYDGQAQPPCKDVDVNEFPVDMVEECMDVDGKLVSR